MDFVTASAQGYTGGVPAAASDVPGVPAQQPNAAPVDHAQSGVGAQSSTSWLHN